MLRDLNKLSDELHTYLRQHAVPAATLVQTAKIMQQNVPGLMDEIEHQIVQYGPDTTVNDLMQMARKEE